jgi:hypothetical protein
MFSNILSKLEPLHSAYPVIKETVPQSALGYHANNKYHGFPPLMSDGRSITASWQPNAVANADLIEKNGIQSNWQYRQYLQNNAVSVMNYNFTESSNDAGYYKRQSDMQSNSVVAPHSTPTMHSSTLATTPTLGQTNSDLKHAYLTREQLDARRVSPVITQEMFLRDKATVNK